MIQGDVLDFGVGGKFLQPEFFDKSIADLRSEDSVIVGRAQRLLERYVPIGPGFGDAIAWASWWKENQRFAFASDAGDYRWYIDPLAKKRGVPSSELRGPKRASQPFQDATAAR